MPASGSVNSELTWPQQQKLTGDVNKLAIERFQATVQKQFMAATVMDSYLTSIDLKGTNHASKDGLGGTTIAPLVPGVAPTGTKIERGRGKVYVKTPMVARAIFSQLEDVQDNIGVKGKTGEIQGEALAEFYDRTGFEMIIRTALITDVAKKKVSTYGLGSVVEMTAVGDEADSVKLESKFNELVMAVQGKIKKRPDFMTGWTTMHTYNTMARNKDLVDRDYSDNNGDYARRTVHGASGVPVKATFHIPGTNEITSTHPLNNAEQDYNVTATMARTLAIVSDPEAVMVGKSIPLTSKVWWNDDNKCWYVDSWMAFGMAPDRLECAGVLLSKAS